MGHVREQFNVGRAVIKVEVTHQTAVGLTAKLAVFLLIDLLEDRALVPSRTLVFLELFAQLFFADVLYPNFEHLIRFGVGHQIIQSSPGASIFWKSSWCRM